MAKIEITSNFYEPNMIILKNHIIIFDKNIIALYNLSGLKLDIIEFELYQIVGNLYKIDNNNCIVVINGQFFFQINIINDRLKINHITIFNEFISDCLILEQNKLFILSFNYYIKIFDNFLLNKEPIQIINNPYRSKLFNWNKDLFITCNYDFILFYKKIFGIKPFQLISKIRLSLRFSFFNKIKLLKLSSKSLLISNYKNIYFIDIQKIKINHNIHFFDDDISFISKIKNKVYLYNNNNLFIFKYFKNIMFPIKLIKIEEKLDAFNYLLNLLLKSSYSNLGKNLRIKCVSIDFPFFDYRKRLIGNEEEDELFINYNISFLMPLQFGIRDYNSFKIMERKLTHLIRRKKDNESIFKERYKLVFLDRNKNEDFVAHDKKLMKLFNKYKYKNEKKEIKNKSNKYKKNYR